MGLRAIPKLVKVPLITSWPCKIMRLPLCWASAMGKQQSREKKEVKKRRDGRELRSKKMKNRQGSMRYTSLTNMATVT